MQLTFDELRQRSNFLAAQLRSLGVVRGDRVLLMLGNVPQLWELTLACMKLGCPIIPTTTLLMPADLRDRVERGRARVVITDLPFAARFEAAAGEQGDEFQYSDIIAKQFDTVHHQIRIGKDRLPIRCVGTNAVKAPSAILPTSPSELNAPAKNRATADEFVQ